MTWPGTVRKAKVLQRLILQRLILGAPLATENGLLWGHCVRDRRL